VYYQSKSFFLTLIGRVKTMGNAMRITQWILGILAALSLVAGIISKLIYIFAHSMFPPRTSPMAFLIFTSACALLSIALSLIKISKIMEK